MTDEHMEPTVTDRGFTHLPALPLSGGYDLNDRWEIVGPHQVGEIRVYESSDAVFPSVWVNMKTDDGELTGHMTIENAGRLARQLIALAENHYSQGRSLLDDGPVRVRDLPGTGGVHDAPSDQTR